MHEEEPSLLSHLTEIRSQKIPEGGVSAVIYAGKIKSESEMSNVLFVHRKVCKLIC